jgi:quercetin dioxygenase-like cupin family protein
MGGFIVAADETTKLQGPVGGALRLALHGDRTGGRLLTFEVEVGPGEGPPHHTHDTQDEAWRVLEGRLRFRLGDDVQEAETGAWVFVPRGTAHCFQNIGDTPARLLTIFTPAGMEPFFEAFANVAREDAAGAFATLGEPVGMHVVGPPLAISHPI